MTYLDSNVILRFLLQDNATQGSQARQRISRMAETFFVTPHILAEVAYVLEKVYYLTRPTIVQGLTALVAQTNIEVCGLAKARVEAALGLCAPSGRVSFADALLWAEAGKGAAPATVLTFDARFPKGHPDPRWSSMPHADPEPP